MKKSILTLMLMVAMLPLMANAYEQLADGVYQDGSTLYITSGVTSLGDLQVNPIAIYTFASTPPICDENTFSGYEGVVYVPNISLAAYFMADYWSNFADIRTGAIEPTSVSLNITNSELIIGESLNLISYVNPNNATPNVVNWTSTDPRIADVNDGLVYGLESGECDIIASCLGKQAICHITVREPNSVILDKYEVTIEQTKQIVLTAYVLSGDVPADSISWATTDTTVAIVNGGVITAVGLGECDVIASYKNNTAFCHVKVIETTIYISLNRHSMKLLPNHIIKLSPTMYPLTTTLKVASSDPEVALARLVNNEIQVIGVNEGTTQIIVNSEDGKAVGDSCIVEVYTDLGDVNCNGYVEISDVTSLIDNLLGNSLSSFKALNADVNRDGNVNISDVTALIDFLLGNGFWPWESESFSINGVSFNMVAIEGGMFTMGATDEQIDEATEQETPTHDVVLSPYYIGQTEVTQALWQAVMGSNPSHHIGDLNYPVELVSWENCQEFIFMLNQLTGRKFRLPTEAEWEYAARGGNKSQNYKYAGDDNIESVAWYNCNSEGTSHAVGDKLANELRIYDMSGNVGEWCQDRFGEYSSEIQTNPIGSPSNSQHVVRGGNWLSDATNCRVSYRNCSEPSFSDNKIGLRLALDADDNTKFCFAESVIKIQIAQSKKIEIINGNGNYTLTLNKDIVTSEVIGDTLSLVGKFIGTTTIDLADNYSGLHTVLTVIVENVECEEFLINGVSFSMIPIEGGTFVMGVSPEEAAGNGGYNTGYTTPHTVTLSSFSIGQTEVTQALWVAVMGYNPSSFNDDLNRPVNNVTKDDCYEFLSKLRTLTGKIFRLPTEAEWEYAARGGKKSHGYKYSGSNICSEVAWTNYCGSPHPVATKIPNELGLYDMSGNVWEQCSDYYDRDYYSHSPLYNPTGPSSPGLHGASVVRGGSWSGYDWGCPVWYRGSLYENSYNNGCGFRIVLIP